MYEECAILARTHYENFPVRNPLLPRSARNDLAAIYAFCRTTDDLGDELEGDRLAALDAWEAALRSSIEDRPPADQPVLTALHDTIKKHDLSLDLFLRLIEANRRDQTVHRYETYDDLLDYCSYSATPVGRMVLGVLGHDATLFDFADATCIGLQLTNFWQDVRRDWEQGRCYIPVDWWTVHGLELQSELERNRSSDRLRQMMSELVGIARDWLQRGWPLSSYLAPRWRPLIRGFTRGGWAICDAIERADFDTLASRPVLSKREKFGIVVHEALRARRRRVALP